MYQVLVQADLSAEVAREEDIILAHRESSKGLGNFQWSSKRVDELIGEKKGAGEDPVIWGVDVRDGSGGGAEAGMGLQ